MALTDIEKIRILIDTELVKKLSSEGKRRNEIAEILGVKPAALSWQMKKVGFSFQKDFCILSQSEIDSLELRYLSGESVPAICKDLPCSKDTAFTILRKRGVEIRSKEDIKFYKGYTINEEAFSDVNEEACAYFYGWLLTDGCLSKKSVSLELSSQDEEILLNLKNYLQSSNTIRRRSRVDSRTGNTYHQSSFAFSHATILERLKAFGFDAKKSLNEKCPEQLAFNRHFWRGVIEGDGHIAKNSFRLEVCGGKELAESFACYCATICPEYTPKVTLNGKMHVGYVSSKYQIKKILDEIYKECNYKLSRKYQVYLEKYHGID